MDRSRIAIGGLAGLVALAALPLFVFCKTCGAPPPPPPPVSAVSASLPLAAVPLVVEVDLVRLDPAGTGYVAGRAEPGTEFEVLLDSASLARIRADERGEWMTAIREPLAPGAHLLAFGSPAGRAATRVMLHIPEQKGPRPLIIRLGGPDLAVVLQAPGFPVALPLTIETLERSAGARLRVGGQAAPGARLELQLGGTPIGTGDADGHGRWTITAAPVTLTPGPHEVRVAQVGARGATEASATAMFVSAPRPSLETVAGERMTVLADSDGWTILHEDGRGTAGETRVFAAPGARPAR